MAQPLPYERDYDFEGYQTGHPSTPLPGDKINLELDQVDETIGQILDRIARLQDDDLALKRKSVGYDQLKDEMNGFGFEPPTTWATGTVYVERDTVFHDSAFYRCLVSHMAGVFATDLAADKWELVADFTEATSAAQTAQAAAEAAQSAAETAQAGAEAAESQAITSAANAATSADSATTSATNASASATAAAGSASDAGASAVAAAASATAAATSEDNAAVSATDAAASASEAAATLAGAVVNTDTATTDMQFVGSGSDLSTDPGKLAKRGDVLARVRIGTTSEAEALTPSDTPDFIETAGFYSAGDGGGAIYFNPVTTDPGKTDQISITAGGMATYYNRLHAEGVVDFAKHGLHLDGREEVAKFEDAFAVALDRGLNKLVMPGGKSVLLTEAAIPAGSFDVDFGLGSTVLADFNGALTGGTANAIKALLGTSDDKLILRNLHVDGQYDSGVTLTAQNRIVDIEGYGYVGLSNYGMKDAGRGGTNETLILDRGDRHTNIHNAYMVEVDGADFDGNAKFEGLVVQSSDKRTRYSIRRVKCRNHISSGTPVSVFNCGPGEVKFCDIDGLTNSAMNLMTEDVEAAFNVIKNVSNSHAIDLYEGGLFYAHRANIHHNHIESIGETDGGVGIRGCGNGLRITDNTLQDCVYAASIESNLSGGAAYGAWLPTTATNISGVVLARNKNFGHNEQAAATNANHRVLGEVGAEISVEIVVSESAYPSPAKQEDGIILEHVSNAAISGKLMHGRDALVRVSADCGVIRLHDAIFAPEAGQAVDVVSCFEADVDKIIFDRCSRPAALDTNWMDVRRSSSGVINEVQFNDSAFFDGTNTSSTGTTSLPANTRVLTNGKVASIAEVAVAVGEDVPANGGHVEKTFSIPGARAATDLLTVTCADSTGLIITPGSISADNTGSMSVRNPTGSTVTSPTINIRYAAIPVA